MVGEHADDSLERELFSGFEGIGGEQFAECEQVEPSGFF